MTFLLFESTFCQFVNLLVCLQYKLTTLHWSVAEKHQLIASGDEKGHVVIWNIFTGDMSSYQPLSTDICVFCLTFSPKTEHILAVGWVVLM